MRNKKKFSHLDAHHRLYISFGIALLSAILFRYLSFSTYLMWIWICYCLSNLLLSWITIFVSHPLEIKKEVRAQDSGPTSLFLFSVGSALISLIGIFVLLLDTKQSQVALDEHILLALASVICSWVLVHTIFLLRYAHLYYDTSIPKKHHTIQAGLEFPGENEPDYLDFAYFSFVIGMTFQVSDVQITSRSFRRLVLLHSFFSFIFNTVIVALSINVVSGVIQK